jgi:hypothetical protein
MRKLILLLTAALAGCGESGQTPTPTPERPVRVEARGHSFLMPARIQGGVVSIDFVNRDRELHEYALARLTPRVATVGAFRRELIDGDHRPPGPELARDLGGVPVLSPGQHVTVTRSLAPGTYVLACYLHGTPMIRSFTITGSSARATARPGASIVAGQHRFAVPLLRSGRQTIELRNEAAGEREFQLVGLKPGKTLTEAKEWFESGAGEPAPVVFSGGFQSIPPGASVIENLELERGVTYFLEDEHGLRARFTPR